jgi:hypothetical protein
MTTDTNTSANDGGGIVGVSSFDSSSARSSNTGVNRGRAGIASLAHKAATASTSASSASASTSYAPPYVPQRWTSHPPPTFASSPLSPNFTAVPSSYAPMADTPSDSDVSKTRALSLDLPFALSVDSMEKSELIDLKLALELQQKDMDFLQSKMKKSSKLLSSMTMSQPPVKLVNLNLNIAPDYESDGCAGITTGYQMMAIPGVASTPCFPKQDHDEDRQLAIRIHELELSRARIEAGAKLVASKNQKMSKLRFGRSAY